MNKYQITVIETCQAQYTVEANTSDEADELFANWADKNQTYVSHQLERNCFGWDFTRAHIVPNDTYVDITYKELIENV